MTEICSGRFVNRIPDFNDVEMWKKTGKLTVTPNSLWVDS